MMLRAIALSLALWGLVPMAATAAVLPEAAVAQVGRGEVWVRVVQAGKAARITAAIEIDAPPQRVWAVMTDCAQAKRIIANLTVCRTVERGAGWDVREQVTRGNLFVPTLRNLVRSDYQPHRMIRFRSVGGDVQVMEGFWRLEPIRGGQGTRVIYESKVQAPIAAPASVVRAGLRADCAKVLGNLRRISEAG
ncbi:MAG: SRPBCC family protein [Caulobacter sp.]